MNRKWLLGIILALTGFIIIVLLIFNRSTRYKRLVIKEDKWNNIISDRSLDAGLQTDEIKFNDYSLLLDKENNTLYYSVVNSSKKYNPIVEYTGSDSKIKIAISDEITDEYIENNHNFKLMIYNHDSYYIYNLVVTNLPIININYNLDNSDKTKNIPMSLYLFDNREDSFNRVINSKGELNITTNADKSDYTFSLNQLSIGHNQRENNISILGLEQHSEYVLNSLESDSEKIRNVFSTNLWNKMSDKKTDEYKYVELFINGEYHGLYSLGYNIEREHVGLKSNEFMFYKSNLSNSEQNYQDNSKLEGYILFNRFIDRVNRKDDIKSNCLDINKDNCKKIDAWSELSNYYEILLGNDINKIKQVSDMDNAINLYLFYLFTEPTNHINEETFSNTYLLFKNTKNGYKVKYYPFGLDDTFNNSFDEEVKYNDNSFIMNYNPVTRLIELNDDETINLVKERYNKLRNTIWSNDSITKLLDQYESDIYSGGAYLRDSNKWNSNIETNKLTNFKSYVINRLTSLDKYIDAL